MADGDASARRDAALTGVVLGGVASAAFLVGAPVTPTALAAGAVATVAAELLLSLRSAWVRAVWGRRAVQATAVVVGLVGGVGLALLVGPWVLTALVAALLTYLLVLAASVLWRRGRRPND
ncbi:hypothetical protein [Salinigranum halophilum]|jgi:hypothetical protein|uniref:hypothetical protein n=1 Tax=Salinigranum halophilum TaxID=2565931 RepID=UPI0010A8EABF|nr:hypothetical protein [Salinigranum halophilum]